MNYLIWHLNGGMSVVKCWQPDRIQRSLCLAAILLFVNYNESWPDTIDYRIQQSWIRTITFNCTDLESTEPASSAPSAIADRDSSRIIYQIHSPAYYFAQQHSQNQGPPPIIQIATARDFALFCQYFYAALTNRQAKMSPEFAPFIFRFCDYSQQLPTDASVSSNLTGFLSISYSEDDWLHSQVQKRQVITPTKRVQLTFRFSNKSWIYEGYEDVTNLPAEERKGIHEKSTKSFRQLDNLFYFTYVIANHNYLTARILMDLESSMDEATDTIRSEDWSPHIYEDLQRRWDQKKMSDNNRKQIERKIFLMYQDRKNQAFSLAAAFGQLWIVPGLGLEMVPINPGSFLMGSAEGGLGHDPREIQHKTTLTQPFWIGRYEVTQNEYISVIGKNKSKNWGLRLPAESLSWLEAVEFCVKLTAQERSKSRVPAGYEYRLPTEAEWEYCCRAGTETAYSFGDSSAQLYRYGNFCDRSYSGSLKEQSDQTQDDGYNGTAEAGCFLPNSWGLFDMHGNVYEWCLDSYGTFSSNPVTDPYGPHHIVLDSNQLPVKIVRGGCCTSRATACRSSARRPLRPSLGRWPDLTGFRIVLAPVEPTDHQESSSKESEDQGGIEFQSTGDGKLFIDLELRLHVVRGSKYRLVNIRRGRRHVAVITDVDRWAGWITVTNDHVSKVNY